METSLQDHLIHPCGKYSEQCATLIAEGTGNSLITV